MSHRPNPRSLAALLAAGLGLLACSAPRIEFENTQPAKEQARQQAQATGSLYGGWRVYQQRCASCHGDWADGAGFMALFGLGTLPLLFTVGVLGRSLSLPVRKKIKVLQPVLLTLAGLLLLQRGIHLDLSLFDAAVPKAGLDCHGG